MYLDETTSYSKGIERICSFINTVCDTSQLRGAHVLVTGGTGQIGAAVVNTLVALGVSGGLNLKVFVGGRNELKFAARFSRKVRENATFLPYEAGVPLGSQEPFDFIVHCAGYGDPKAFAEDPVGVIKSNINGVDLLLDMLVCQGYGRLLFVSSGEVYGCATNHGQAFSEDCLGAVNCIEARSCYPESKRAAETLCCAYLGQYGVDSVIARQCHVFGPGFSERDSRATAQFLRAATAGTVVQMKGAGAQIRSWLYELDVACAYVFLLLQGKKGSAYNVAANIQASVREFAQSAARAGGIAFEAPECPLQDWGMPSGVLDGTKLAKLGWESCFEFDEALVATIDSLRRIL